MRGRHRASRSAFGRMALGALSPVALVLAYLPRRAGLWIGRRLGDLAWITLRRRRAVAIENLTRALGAERTGSELRRLGRRSFQHLGMTLVEACVFFFRSPSVMLSRVELAGGDRLKAAAAEGRGILLLAAHYGNWELLAASHVLGGLPLSEVVRPLDHPLLDRMVGRLRERTGVEVIPKRRGLRGVLDALRRGRMVGILMDQNASRGEGVFAPFFGVPASTSKAMAVISLRSGAPVLPVFIRRQPNGRHRVEVEPPLPPPPDGDVLAYTGAFNRAIESAIRRAPEQWLWMHRRWRTRPAAQARSDEELARPQEEAR